MTATSAWQMAAAAAARAPQAFRKPCRRKLSSRSSVPTGEASHLAGPRSRGIFGLVDHSQKPAAKMAKKADATLSAAITREIPASGAAPLQAAMACRPAPRAKHPTHLVDEAAGGRRRACPFQSAPGRVVSVLSGFVSSQEACYHNNGPGGSCSLRPGPEPQRIVRRSRHGLCTL